MTDKGKLLFLGVGNVALAVNSLANEYSTKCGTTRRVDYVSVLESVAISPILISGVAPRGLENPAELQSQTSRGLREIAEPWGDISAAISEACADADVLVSFPPDGITDSILARACGSARKIVYISSTGVYGSVSGVIDETTDVDRRSPRAASRLQAENIWRDLGAIVLRAPGIYGRNYGLHVSLAQNKFRIPGDGRRYSSRIHDEDLARIILRAFEVGKKGSVFVVGDRSPAPYIEVVTWLCERLNIPLPESVPLEQVHHTLQADRRIDSTRALSELQIELKYPSYKQGFLQCLS